jgi:hypothetical protein
LYIVRTPKHTKQIQKKIQNTDPPYKIIPVTLRFRLEVKHDEKKKKRKCHDWFGNYHELDDTLLKKPTPDHG